MKVSWVALIIILNVILLDYHYDINIPVSTVIPVVLVTGMLMIMWFNELTIYQFATQLVCGRPKPIVASRYEQPVSESPVELPQEVIDTIPPSLVPIITGGLGVMRGAMDIFGNPEAFQPPKRKTITDDNHEEDIKLLTSVIEEVD